MSSACESSLAKMSVFGTYGAAGKDFGEETVAKGADHGADLIGRNDGAVELVRLHRRGLRRAVPSGLCG